MREKHYLTELETHFFLQRKKIKNIYIRMDQDFNIIVNDPKNLNLTIISNFVKESYPKLMKRKNKEKKKDKVFPVKENEILLFNEFVRKEIDINQQLKIALEKYLNENYLSIINKMRLINVPTIRLVRVKTYLGQYNKRKNEISLNILIAHLTKELIEYIIIHELAHTKYLHHQKEFWNYVSEFLPNYKELRKKTKKEFVYYEGN